jgi:hypothetical protein
MKTNACFFFLFMLFCFNTVGQPIYKENTVRYAGIEEIKTYHLYNKKINPACHLKINFFYPEIYYDKSLEKKLQSLFSLHFFGKEYADFPLKEAVKIYANAYVEDYKDTFEKSEMYKKEVEEAQENGRDIREYAFFSYNQEKTMRNTILFNRGNIISQVVNVYEYTGGAHGASSTQGMVFDMNTGKKIDYEAVFHENTEEALSELLLSHLMSERKYTDKNALIEAGFDFNVIDPTGNFVVDDKGMTFIYNPYELGAYVLGIVEIFVPYSDLIIYMKPESTLFRWAGNHHAGNPVKFETALLRNEISDIQFTFPVAYFDKTVLQNLQKQFISNAFGETYLSLSPIDVPTAFYEKELNENEEIPDQKYMQKNTFFFNQNNLISYEIETYRHQEGDAHGMTIQKGFAVNLQTGKNMSYKDIFKPDTKKEISSLLVGKLLKKEDYEIENMIPHDNFYISEEGITFIYNAYEIAPYALGTIKITLHFTEIIHYLNPYLNTFFNNLIIQ